MKVPSIIIVVGAMLALASTAANARIAPEMGPLTKAQSLVSYYPGSVTLKAKVKKSGGNLSQKSGKGKTGGKGKPKRPLLIWVQGWQEAPEVPISSDECQSSGNGCTPQQDCEIWGYNCILVEHPALQAAPAAESSSASTEAAGSNGNLSSGEVASAESSASDAAKPIAQVANLIEENWDC